MKIGNPDEENSKTSLVERNNLFIRNVQYDRLTCATNKLAPPSTQCRTELSFAFRGRISTGGAAIMAARKQFQSSLTVSSELAELLRQASGTPVTEDELREQRVSFAYGNAPQSELITKDSVRRSSQNIRLK